MAKLYLEATRMIILGVDPGIHGGLAIVAVADSVAKWWSISSENAVPAPEPEE